MLKVNGKEVEFKKGQTLLSFLEEKNLELGKIVVEYNAEIMAREKWGEVVLKDGDELEVISFVGGG